MESKQFYQDRLVEYELNMQTARDENEPTAFERWNRQAELTIKRLERLESEAGGDHEEVK